MDPVVGSLLSHLTAGRRCWISDDGSKQFVEIANESGELIEEVGEHNQRTAQYLVNLAKSLIKSNETTPQAESVFNAAVLFDRQVTNQSIATAPIVTYAGDNLKELHTLVRDHALGQKLKISDKFLAEHPDIRKFLHDNIIMYRVDVTYIDRGYGPKVENDQLFFPVNRGTAFKPNVQWIPWNEIPVDHHKKVKWGYGPFGFEDVHPHIPDKILPIKLVDTPEHVKIGKNQVLMEIVTSKGEKTLYGFIQKLLKGGPGHSWIRTYHPQMDETGKPTGKSLMYSFGVGTGNHRVLSPDVREFKGDESFTARLVMDQGEWEEIRKTVEQLQQAFLYKDIPDAILPLYTDIKRGTCVNFALYVFGRAYEKTHGHCLTVEGNTVWQTHILQPIARGPVGSALKSILGRVTSSFVKEKLTIAVQGYMPWMLIEDLESRVDETGQINQDSKIGF